jgi:predicted ribosome quality control (RQC) complex YloA/Tae2 family protein
VARVGRSAKDNDELTLRYSKPSDLWLHARNLTGSHVIVSLEKSENPSQDVLIDGAHLAAYFSSARNDNDAEVMYALKKYVHKPKGAPPGTVKLLKSKTLYLKIDEMRLKNILAEKE